MNLNLISNVQVTGNKDRVLGYMGALFKRTISEWGCACPIQLNRIHDKNLEKYNIMFTLIGIQRSSIDFVDDLYKYYTDLDVTGHQYLGADCSDDEKISITYSNGVFTRLYDEPEEDLSPADILAKIRSDCAIKLKAEGVA
ncbi:MAG: hypothetical protein KZQ57_00675 [gamma proteobacterium symbiont of Lucinoma myriamae]|nr:hypothetical protein [gamma proteobacterium symbiont of Lucinoma myriamae]